MKHGTHIIRYVNMSDLTGGLQFEKYLARFSDLQDVNLQDKYLILTKKVVLYYVDFHKMKQQEWCAAFLAALSAEQELLFRVELNV